MSNSTSDTIHAMVGQSDSVLSLFLLINGFTLINIIFLSDRWTRIKFYQKFSEVLFYIRLNFRLIRYQEGPVIKSRSYCARIVLVS